MAQAHKHQVKKVATMRLHPFDLISAVITPPVAFWLRDPSYMSAERADIVLLYAGLGLLAAIVAFYYFRVSFILSAHFGARDVPRIGKATLLTVVLTVIAVFIVNRMEDVPRSLPILHVLLLGGILTFGRFFAAQTKLRKGVARNAEQAAPVESIVLVGSNRLAGFYIRIVDSLSEGSQRIVAVLDTNPRRIGRIISGHEIVGSPDRIDSIIDEYAEHGIFVNRIVIADTENELSSESILQLKEVCSKRGIACASLREMLNLTGGIAPEAAPALFSKPVAGFAEDRQAGFDSGPSTRPAASAPAAAPVSADAGTYWKIKRAVDIIVSGAAVIVLLPFFFIAAVLVWLDCGLPVIFWQERLGRGGRPIFVYKFRTLHKPFDRYGNRLSFEERTTRVGKIMRATRLDELPQLINILRGDMSLIGPRPLLPADQPEGDSIRLTVRPGITGWAQVHGGKLVGAEEKNALDEWYIRHASFAVDARIILRTIRIFFSGDVRDDDAIQRAVEEHQIARAP